MSKTDRQTPNKADQLVETNGQGAIELSESDLESASGGRAKSADKVTKALHDYLRG